MKSKNRLILREKHLPKHETNFISRFMPLCSGKNLQAHGLRKITSKARFRHAKWIGKDTLTDTIIYVIHR